MRWSSKTFHESLRDEDYSEKSGVGAGFEAERTPDQLAALRRRHGLGVVPEFRSGRDAPALRVSFQSMAALSCAYLPQASEALHLELKREEAPWISALKAEIEQQANGSGHLAACLDVLENIDIADVATALFNLRRKSDRFLPVGTSAQTADQVAEPDEPSATCAMQ
jgi:hypothetical protein